MVRSPLPKILCSTLLVTLFTGCGVSEFETSKPAIRGGENVEENAAGPVRQSTVALTTDFVSEANKENGPLIEQGGSFCTGTIVGMRTIVTAAHCIQAIEGRDQKGDLIFPEASHWLVYFGTQVAADGDFVRAAKVIPHPDWDPSQTLSPFPSKSPNDVGVILLEEPIPSYMTPVTIADISVNVKDQEAILAGYGVTKNRNTNDTGTLRTITSKFSGANGSIARVSHGGWFQGICAGDSGGPAYVDVDGELQLVGAASTGIELPGLGCVGSGSNSTDVRYYSDWILSFE